MGKMKDLYIDLETKANILAAINRTQSEPILESLCQVFPTAGNSLTYKFIQENEKYDIKKDRVTILYYLNKKNDIVKYEIYKYGEKTHQKEW